MCLFYHKIFSLKHQNQILDLFSAESLLYGKPCGKSKDAEDNQTVQI